MRTTEALDDLLISPSNAHSEDTTVSHLSAAPTTPATANRHLDQCAQDFTLLHRNGMSCSGRSSAALELIEPLNKANKSSHPTIPLSYAFLALAKWLRR